MTLKDILEGYGIDFNSLSFTTEGDACTIDEIKDSIANNEIILVEDSNFRGRPKEYNCMDFDILDDEKEIRLYTL